jgi:phospholipid/cholesterol/gamma-HCH transport system permease protein
LFFFIAVGRRTIFYLREMGRMLLFLFQFVFSAPRPPYRILRVIKEMHFIGVKSLFIIALTSGFTGMVLGLQGYHTLRQFGSESALGSLVALSLIRELGPVLGSLMVTARAGSAMTAELGIMRISEQIDALDVMTLDPIKFLVAPKMLAGILVVPLLVGIFDVIGIYGGYIVGVKLLGVNAGRYFDGMKESLVFKDVWGGAVKSLSFGLIVTWVSCYKGYNCGHGAKGVSDATTEAVVLSAILVLMWDYIVTSLLL